MHRQRPHPRFIILDHFAPVGRLEMEVTLRLSPKLLRLGRSRLRLVVAYHPAAPSLN